MPSQSTTGCSKENREQKVTPQPRLVTQDVCVLSVNFIFISVESEWLDNYVGRQLGVTYGSSIVEVIEECRAVILLGNGVYVIKFKLESSVQARYCYTIKHQHMKF